ncbi:MAG: AMP-binding protein [Verrucomicrobiota bacterium]
MERAGLARLLGGARAEGARQILIAEADPQRFMAAFACAVGGAGEVFLCDPAWRVHEHSQLDELLASKPQVAGFRSQAAQPSEAGWLCIATGGTGGRLKFARHDTATIAAAVRGFTRHFGLPRVNAAGVLPLHHVSGLMAWMRCVLTGGEYLPLDWKAVEEGARPELPGKTAGWTISLVPTQLERLMRQPAAVDWLRRFRIIFLGGAAAWPALLDRAAELRLPLSPGYGMTETAAMIAALRPEEFLAGMRGCGALLPHVRVGFDAEGTILVDGDSLFRGYYPGWREPGEFATQDGGWLDERGHLHVSGRRDAVIVTGGEKVNPAEVEAVLRGSGELAEVVVLGVPDAEWGERVVAVYPAAAKPDLARVAAAAARLLSPAKRPKQWVALPGEWPANVQGKIDRSEVARRAGASGAGG